MTDYTVLLQRPDYATCHYGTDTYLAHVQADSVEAAQEKAQLEVLSVDYPEAIDRRACDFEDYAVLFMAEGHLEDKKTY